jgi:hypothetical protein
MRRQKAKDDLKNIGFQDTLEDKMQSAERLMRITGYAYLLVICTEVTARADMGVPMIFVTMPLMVFALIPVILIEAFVLARRFQQSLKSVLWAASAANLVSTFIGIPITWCLLALIQLLTGGGGAYQIHTILGRFFSVTWQGSWLFHLESELYWRVPASILFLLIPFFFASYWVEYLVARRMLKNRDRGEVKRGVYFANLASYALLALIVFGWLLMSHRLRHQWDVPPRVNRSSVISPDTSCSRWFGQPSALMQRLTGETSSCITGSLRRLMPISSPPDLQPEFQQDRDD